MQDVFDVKKGSRSKRSNIPNIHSALIARALRRISGHALPGSTTVLEALADDLDKSPGI
jgi:hypothetical protein